ncbi:formate/nitrite transporter family protein [Halocalculus aciditolerans]|uniref:Uncharacterized protein n=1 Tax=Halocalculus aciditolerans TaxID=1383812 RepID=A0A830F6R7_9EURY|nr:formate/nitrite transporter family protein [Halocalculus aciditolerans]GGL46372.1 hypothetical protein GCM10009039_00940 [Halocalculus aciditolerans]
MPTDTSHFAGSTSSTDILARQIHSGLNQLERSASGLFLSAFSAGLDIGFGPLFMAVILTISAPSFGDPLKSLLVANAYAVGFIFVVLGRTELFTEHTTLAVLPVIDGRASVLQLLRLWGVVYVGNVVGATIFAVALAWLAPEYGIAEPRVFAEMAGPIVHHDAFALFAGAMLAGWLMGLLSWLVGAADSTLSRLVVVWLVAAVIGLAHLPHSIAGTVEVVAAVLTSSDFTLFDYGRFALFATTGNVVGGTVFVALLKYGHIVRGGE